MTTATRDLVDELDERGFRRCSLNVDGGGSRTVEPRSPTRSSRRRSSRSTPRTLAAAPLAETGWIDVWHPGEVGVIGERRHRSARPRVGIAAPTVRRHRDGSEWQKSERYPRFSLHSCPATDIRASTPITTPTFPLHVDGRVDSVSFYVMLTPHRPETGTFRALPGSHKTPPQFNEWNSAMPPHADEVRVEAEPGDVVVYSPRLWKSATFNTGHKPNTGLWIG